MVGHYEKAFLAQPQPFCFHGGCRHFVGFACANFVRKQRITAIKHMSDGVALVLSEGDLRFMPTKWMWEPSYSRGLVLLNNSLYCFTSAMRRWGSCQTQLAKAS